MAQLFDNKWFKHLIATWLEQRDAARDAVCSFPVKDVAQLITMLQTRGEANALNNVVHLAYDEYKRLVEERENERT